MFPDIFMREEKQQVDDLLDKILMPENMRAATDEVRKNKGAPGVDKMPVEELMGYFALNESAVIRQIDPCRNRTLLGLRMRKSSSRSPFLFFNP